MKGFLVRLPGAGSQKRQLNKENVAPIAKCRKRPETDRPSVQMYLDLGQKSLGKTTVCKICEMVYVTDDIDDTENHRNFCREVSQASRIRTTAGVSVIEKFEDAKQHILQVSWRKAKSADAISAAVRRAMEELGSSSDMITETDTVYLLVDSKHLVMGCMVCEQVQHVDTARCAYITESNSATVVEVGSRTCCEKIMSWKGGQEVENDSRREANARDRDGEISERKAGRRGGAVLGVKLMWTSAAHRRQRVAQRLLDAARKNMVYGTVVSMESIAFSQPTENGLAFAQAYCKTERILAYA